MKPNIERSANMPANINVHVNRPGPVRRIATVLGVAAVATAGLNYFTGDIVEQEVDQRESSVSVTWTKLGEVDVQCFVAGEATVESNVRTKLSVAGKQIGPSGYKANIKADAQTHVCYDGAFMSTLLDETTGKQTVTINRAGQKIITEWGKIVPNADVEGTIAEAGGTIYSFLDVVGIEGPKENINQKEGELAGALETATKNSLETQCIDELGNNLDGLLLKGLYLQAQNRGIDVSSITVQYIGDTPKPSPVDFDTEAGRFGFKVVGELIENVNCNVSPGAFDDVEQLTEHGPSVKVTTVKKAGAN